MTYKNYLIVFLLILPGVKGYAQLPAGQLKITGNVKDKTGTVMPGVSVFVQGTRQGGPTDANGKYSIQVAGEKSVLVFAYTGFVSRQRTVGKDRVIDMVLSEDQKGLNEVVIIGYGTSKRGDVISAITSVKGSDLQQIPVTNLDAVMQGKAAGVQVIQNSGAPGDEAYLRIRGSGSLFGENRPLYVIDGVPMNNISAGSGPQSTDGQRVSAQNDINPNDIESVEILKDAAAAAIYGSRGGNGVILITTKKGALGKAKFNFNMYTGVAEVRKRLSLLNGAEYAQLIKEERANGGQPVENDIINTGVNTNWQDQVFRPAPISNYALSVSGGTDKASYYASGSYFDQKGTIIGQKFKRLNGRINFDAKATDELKIGANVTGSHSMNHRRDGSFSNQSVLTLALVQNPNNPVYNPDGSYYMDAKGRLNPVMMGNELRFIAETDRYVGNVYGNYTLAKGLQFKSSIGFDHLSITDDRYLSRLVNNGSNASGSLSVYSVMLWVNENTLSYNKTLNKHHKLTALLGQSYQESATRRIAAAGNTNSTDIIESITGFTNRTEASDYRSKWAIVSYFGRAGYTYKDRFLFESALRIDGSSRFGKHKRFGYFPSVSGGWKISNEAFMKKQEVISNLKLRASIGVTGNNEGLGTDFPSLATYNAGTNYGTLPGVAAGSLSNADLSWESTTQTNLGLDFGLFKDRINVVVDAYRKVTNDLIFKLELPYSSGFSRTFGANIGQMRNDGLEFQVNSRNLLGKFSWTTDFNISFNRNKITHLPLTVAGDPRSADFTEGLPNSFNTTNPTSIFRIGEPVGSFFGYRNLGVDPLTGDFIYEDITGDGAVTTADRQIVGNALPLHTGGITNTFGYKGFDLSVFFYWSYGNDVYNQTRNVLERMSSLNNGNKHVLRRWTPGNTLTNVPKAIWGDPAGTDGLTNAEVSQRFIEDGSFLRLKNITLGYALPSAFQKRMKLSNARFYVSAQNLFTVTNYSGYDPEVQNQQFKNSQLGIDWASQPQPRTLMFGFSLGF
ncbi:TonB-linked outer membrane protein, SusC/RagA family [Pedobacter steynii]|uniref:TonB-linked outer membrane protein, SusC/RagA family n=1 Tax=Pedobacter steynii TaxID=430522 RepID=A0A1G9NZR2_9SPHI|nr:TonB-dependent receptor [Pedobacter steynii]NQX39136.1 TonB-dependent receptor [Pedobacter steynii]SDL92076.1 TonB-linked outer membrane protein, SusC/RagA family [Pedobacter steynii]